VYARGCGSLCTRVDPFSKINSAIAIAIAIAIISLPVCVLAITPRCGRKAMLLLAGARKLN